MKNPSSNCRCCPTGRAIQLPCLCPVFRRRQPLTVNETQQHSQAVMINFIQSSCTSSIMPKSYQVWCVFCVFERVLMCLMAPLSALSRWCLYLENPGCPWIWSPGWTTPSRFAAPAWSILRCGATGVSVTISVWTVRTIFSHLFTERCIADSVKPSRPAVPQYS